MGTYIHAYIEVDYSKREPAFSDADRIDSLADGEFNLDRAYQVFDALAGGREILMSHEYRDASRRPLIEPRGIPLPCSDVVSREYSASGTHAATWLLPHEVDASFAHHRIAWADELIGYRIVRSAMSMLADEVGAARPTRSMVQLMASGLIVKKTDSNMRLTPARRPYRVLAGVLGALMLIGAVVFTFFGLQAGSWRLLIWAPICLLNAGAWLGLARAGQWSGRRRDAAAKR